MKTIESRYQSIWGAPLSANEKLLLLALMRFVGADGECWPGIKRISEMCSFSESVVRRSIAMLEASNCITRSTRFDQAGRQTSNLYKVNFDALESLSNRQGEGVKSTGGGCQIDRGEGVKSTGGGCQSDTQTNPINLFRRTNPKEKRKETRQDFREPPIDTMKSRFFSTEIQPWKSGRGPNDWNEDFLTYLCKYWTTPQKSFGRADAIGYVSKRQHPDHPEHPTLFARFKEFAQRTAPRNSPPAQRESRQAEEISLPPEYVPELILKGWRGKKIEEIPNAQIRAALAREMEGVSA